MKTVRALALALLPDPFYQAITVECDSVEAQLLMLESYFEYSMLEAQRTGRLVMAPNEGDGAAVWLLPRSSDEQASESAAKTGFLSRLLGPRGSKNYHAIVEYMAPLAERHVPASAWYLSILGVNPACQGQGLGQMLLQSTLEEASSLEQVCDLETFAPRNMRFYQRLGFSQVAQYQEQTTGCPYVIMRREASQAALSHWAGLSLKCKALGSNQRGWNAVGW